MTKVCKITGKTPTVGHKVSHSNIKTKKRFDINLKEHRFYIPSQKRFIRLRVTTKGIRIIDKLGIESVLQSMGKWTGDVQERA